MVYADYNFDRSRTTHEHHFKSLLVTSILSIEFRSERNVDIRRVVGDAFRTENSRFNYRSLLGEANPSVFGKLLSNKTISLSHHLNISFYFIFVICFSSFKRCRSRC